MLDDVGSRAEHHCMIVGGEFREADVLATISLPDDFELSHTSMVLVTAERLRELKDQIRSLQMQLTESKEIKSLCEIRPDAVGIVFEQIEGEEPTVSIAKCAYCGHTARFTGTGGQWFCGESCQTYMEERRKNNE